MTDTRQRATNACLSVRKDVFEEHASNLTYVNAILVMLEPIAVSSANVMDTQIALDRINLTNVFSATTTQWESNAINANHFLSATLKTMVNVYPVYNIAMDTAISA